MADPTRYQPSYSFTGWQVSDPRRPLPAQRVDIEFQNLALTTDEIIAALGQIRRSDGKLASQLVTFESLTPAVRAAIGGPGHGDADGNLRIGDIVGLADALEDKADLSALLGLDDALDEVAARSVTGGGLAGRTVTGSVTAISVPVATQAQAEAGVDNGVAMTPLRVAQAIAAIGGDAGGTNPADAAMIVRTPVYFDKGDPLTATRLFAREGAAANHRAQKLVDAKIPFNTVTTGGQSAFHVRAVAEGSSQNGPGPASIGASISAFKEGFGTGAAKGGELDGLYVVVRQDSPRTGAQGVNDPDRGDGCGILIDAAVHENVGFVGGIEGATTVLSNSQLNANGNPAPTRRLVYQLGCTDTTSASSIGLFTSAAMGSHSAGLLVYGAEGAGGSFDHYIQCRTDTVGIFNVDRGGTVSMGRRLNSGQLIDLAVHMAVQSDFSLSWLNAGKTVPLLNLDQNGNLTARGGVSGSAINSTTNVQAQGNIIAGGKVSATLLRLTPGTAGSQSSEFVAGTFSVGASGRPRFCMANGQAPVFLATTTS